MIHPCDLRHHAEVSSNSTSLIAKDPWGIVFIDQAHHTMQQQQHLFGQRCGDYFTY